ncbi:MAG: DUF6496 domain-containing protein, partial [Pseudomonadota bacterium]
MAQDGADRLPRRPPLPAHAAVGFRGHRIAGCVHVERPMAKRKAKKKYGRKASQKVERSVREMKQGRLRSGGSGRKVTSRRQAVAIGLSEAR